MTTTLARTTKTDDRLDCAPLVGPLPDWVPARFVTVEEHQTPAEIMKLDLPRRIHALTQRHGSPLLVIDRAELIRLYRSFRRLLPRVQPYFAMKANPHPDIVRTFAALGSCYDVASEGEMRLALACGVEPSRLLFANTIKRPEALTFADKMGVDRVTFDSEPELYKIAKHAPGCRVLARIKVANVGSQVALSLKFGADAGQVVPLLQKAKALGLRPDGVSFHVGSQCSEYANFRQAFELSAEIIDDARKVGMELKTVDIGGGFPIKHTAGEESSLATFAPRMRRDLDRYFGKEIDLIAEPGRSLVGTAGTLIMRVVGRAIRDNLNFYYLDDGVYGDLSGILFDHAHYDFRALKRTPKYLSVLAGPTCDSIDTIARGVQLPELDVGDFVYVPHCGAYSCASAVTFNGIPPAKVIVV